MEALQASIENIRFKNANHESRYFIPETALFEVVSKSTVQPSLRSIGAPVHEIEDLTKGILQGARKCFAILVLLNRGKAISGFFRHDSLQESHPDDRLPYTSEALQRIFKEQANSPIIKGFLEKQWEFAIPIMHRNMIFRELETEAILPILDEDPAGEGSMGKAWKIELHPQCHRLPLESHRVVRKQIECSQNNEMTVFRDELKNLSLLMFLEHPNIVQLYCSYIYRRKYNLIFALASGGSLADFLNGQQDAKGPEGSQLLLALADLASAIDAMHNFTSEAFDLRLAGCHHDLAPRNILIHGETFLLADFGLSTFRDAEADSLTTFKEVRGSYVAPECQIFHDGQVKSKNIGRASDIWSFGCILLEVLTHMVWGPVGVVQFRNKRKVQVTPEIEWFRFHRGPDKPNDEVVNWLNDLEVNGEPSCKRLVGLIQEMLSMDPSKRPRSARVLMVLRGISILSFAKSVSQSLDAIYTTSPTADRMLDKMRFESWLFAFTQLVDEIKQNKLENFDFDFSEIVKALKEIDRISEGSKEVVASAKNLQLRLLRYQHAKLVEGLPLYYRSIAKEQLVEMVLQSDDTEQPGGLSTAITKAGEEDMGVLVAFKHLTALAETGRLTDQRDLVLDQKSITHRVDVNIHSLALLETTSERILVEWLRYNGSWADEVIREQLLHRLTSVVGLLHAESTAQIPGSLPCQGIFHDLDERAFGVVYSLPFPRAQPVTLYGLLSAARSPYRPLLEYRFRLAFDICQCIYTFHKVGWLHRSLHSMNILFFPPEGAQKAEWAKEPRILGFSRSRENRLDSFTDGPDDNGQLRKYYHPEYLAHKERYREEFDYYSVGILLLEIGLWTTLSTITDSSHFQDISDEQFRRKIIATRVPQLGVAMGTRYMEATRRCLEGDFVGSPGYFGDGRDRKSVV